MPGINVAAAGPERGEAAKRCETLRSVFRESFQPQSFSPAGGLGLGLAFAARARPKGRGGRGRRGRRGPGDLEAAGAGDVGAELEDLETAASRSDKEVTQIL